MKLINVGRLVHNHKSGVLLRAIAIDNFHGVLYDKILDDSSIEVDITNQIDYYFHTIMELSDET